MGAAFTLLLSAVMIRINMFYKVVIAIAFSVCVQAADAQINIQRFLSMGRSDLFNDNYTESIKNLTVAIEAAPKKFEPYFFRGLAKYSLGDYSGAITDFDASIAINPYFSYNYQYRAVCQSRLKSYHKALQDYALALQRHPSNADTYLNRGTTKLQLEMYHAALADFDTALLYAPKNEGVWIQKSIVLHLLKQDSAALEAASKAIRLNYSNDRAYRQKGILEYEMKDFKAAIFDFELAMKLDGDNPLLYFFRGLSRFQSGDTLGAYEDYAHVLSLDPHNALVYYNRSILKAEQKLYKQAIKDLDEVLRLNKDNIYAWYNKGVNQVLAKDYKGAEHSFGKAIALFPDFARAYLNRSSVRQQLKDEKGAYADYLAAQNIREKFAGMAIDSVPEMYRDSLKFDRLIAFQSDFANVKKDSGFVQYKNAYVALESNYVISLLSADEAHYIESKRYQYFLQAIADLNEYGLKDVNLSIQLTKHMAALSTEQAKQMLLRMDSMLSEQPNSPLNYMYIGILNERLGDTSTAEGNYLKAIEIDPTFGLAYYNLSQLAYQKAEAAALAKEEAAAVFVQTEQSAGSQHSPLQLQQALDYCSKALQIYPNSAFLYYNRANYYAKSQRLVEAIEDYNTAIALQANFAEAYYNKGLALLLLKDNAAACPCLSKAGELGITQAYNLIKRYCSQIN